MKIEYIVITKCCNLYPLPATLASNAENIATHVDGNCIGSQVNTCNDAIESGIGVDNFHALHSYTQFIYIDR